MTQTHIRRAPPRTLPPVAPPVGVHLDAIVRELRRPAGIKRPRKGLTP